MATVNNEGFNIIATDIQAHIGKVAAVGAEAYPIFRDVNHHRLLADAATNNAMRRKHQDTMLWTTVAGIFMLIGGSRRSQKNS